MADMTVRVRATAARGCPRHVAPFGGPVSPGGLGERRPPHGCVGSPSQR
jgi:hypothetical protein